MITKPLPTARLCAPECACRSPGREIYQRANLGVHVYIRTRALQRYYEARRAAWLESLSREQISRMAIGARGAR